MTTDEAIGWLNERIESPNYDRGDANARIRVVLAELAEARRELEEWRTASAHPALTVSKRLNESHGKLVGELRRQLADAVTKERELISLFDAQVSYFKSRSQRYQQFEFTERPQLIQEFSDAFHKARAAIRTDTPPDAGACPICGGTEHADPLPGTVGRRCVRCCETWRERHEFYKCVHPPGCQQCSWCGFKAEPDAGAKAEPPATVTEGEYRAFGHILARMATPDHALRLAKFDDSDECSCICAALNAKRHDDAAVERLVEALRLCLMCGLPPHDISGQRMWQQARDALAPFGTEGSVE